MPDPDHFAALGIPVGSSIPVIKRAYHKLALRLHPDKNKDPGPGDKFKTVTHAYEVLIGKAQDTPSVGAGTSTQTQTFNYSAFRPSTATFNSTHGLNRQFADFVAGFHFQTSTGTFGTGVRSSFAYTTANARKRKRDDEPKRPLPPPPAIEHELYCTLEQLARGCKRHLSVKSNVFSKSGAPSIKVRRLVVSVEPGSLPGEKLKYSKIGSQREPGGDPSGVIVTLRLQDDGPLALEGRNFVFFVHMTSRELSHYRLNIIDPRGEAVKKQILGPICSGTEHILHGRGMPSPKPGIPSGDLIVRFVRQRK